VEEAPEATQSRKDGETTKDQESSPEDQVEGIHSDTDTPENSNLPTTPPQRTSTLQTQDP